jgi:hypothetical protein
LVLNFQDMYINVLKRMLYENFPFLGFFSKMLGTQN